MPSTLNDLRHMVRQATSVDESQHVSDLLAGLELSPARREAVRTRAIELVERCREQTDKAGTLDAFLQEFGLSNNEGIALMCLAEALLRVPDDETADRLIAEKIHSGDWGSHKGKSSSRFVNASVWGLMLTGKVVELEDEITQHTASWMQRLVGNMGEPIIRQAMLQAMRIMGGQYVLGRSIDEALRRGRSGNRAGTRFSFDMLGEGARNERDARAYFESYAQAIELVAASSHASSVIEGDGVSVKLSALYPRYEFRQKKRVMRHMLPRIRELALAAKAGGIGLSIDAEECDRLDLSLDIFEALARDEALAGWNGLGFVLQAYQKRSLAVAWWLARLGEETNRRIMVRLVKGAYWDSEIKHAQELGLDDYPVFTRKCHTDLSYLRCAEVLLQTPEVIYPQFATHNAHTVAFIEELTDASCEFEFQRLHGMGQLLYDELQDQRPEVSVRVYAPVGTHRDLLPYLVRRLLENGANSSFVNRFLDAETPAHELLTDPANETLQHGMERHRQIPPPRLLYGDQAAPWLNAAGIDLAAPLQVAPLLNAIAEISGIQPHCAPLVDGEMLEGNVGEIRNPARRSAVVGTCVEALPKHIERALESAVNAQSDWDASGAEHRAQCLERVAELMEEDLFSLIGLIVAEAGRTIDDALSEVREAVDFCRYYAQQARCRFADTLTLPGPAGEENELSLHGRGVFLCVSPWNFPLAIFTGQISAALAAGNAVIAKPAEQTPLIAFRAVQLMHRAGVPVNVLHLLPGDGVSVAAPMVRDERISGVAFTGSTATAKTINRQLAAREGAIVPLIAETGGMNVMLVDSTALPEQVVDDVIISAFQSAGQRCSALRVLFLQEEVAETILEMLAGAMADLIVDNPAALATDIGPVIDIEARDRLQHHCKRINEEAKLIAQVELQDGCAEGSFFAPRVYEIESLSQLPEEVFGPVLHVIRYKSSDINRVYDDINATGYGLTLGVHSRIDGFSREVFARTRVGNTYINRNIVGAVVGVNPFGGQGLSGTGPKAGGPHYLLRFACERTRTENIVARGGNAQLFNLED